MQWQKTGAVRWLLSLAFGVWAVPWTGSRESVLAGGGTCGTLIPGISLHAPDLEIGFFWWGQPEAGSPTGRLSSLLTRMTHSLRGARPASKTKEPVDIKHLKEFVNYSRSRARKTHLAAPNSVDRHSSTSAILKTDVGENEWAWPWSTTSDTKTIKSHNI